MRMQEYTSLRIETQDACPVCGAGIALAEVEPHPKHFGLEIHGFICVDCGPVKSMVVKSRLLKEQLC